MFKKSMKKVAMLFTVLSLGSVVVPGIVSSKAYAESVPVTEVYDKESNRIIYSNGDYLVLKTQSETQERALGTITVFVGELVIGWIIDGVFEAATGYTPSQWIARALSYAFSHPNVSEIHLDNFGCSINPIHSQFGCH